KVQISQNELWSHAWGTGFLTGAALTVDRQADAEGDDLDAEDEHERPDGILDRDRDHVTDEAGAGPRHRRERLSPRPEQALPLVDPLAEHRARVAVPP